MIRSEEDRFWTKYCGFLDLSLEQFMTIQNCLLLDQLRKLGSSDLVKRIIGGNIHTDIEWFRQSVPLTTYEDYLPDLNQSDPASLPDHPFVWAHTSGNSASFKQIPYTYHFYREMLDNLMAVFILSCSHKKGHSSLARKDHVLFNVAPSPYLSGILAKGASEIFDLEPVYSPDLHDDMEFKEKIAKGFEVSLEKGIDILLAMTSVLVKMGNDFYNQTGKRDISRYLSNPRVLYRLGRAMIKAKIEGRPILPKDLWPVKSLIGWGIDTEVYRDQVRDYWGLYPYQFHAATEAGIIAMQSWTRKDLSFTPNLNFLEFIPEDEWLKSMKDHNYTPSTVTLSGVRAGERYELVITSFHGMPFIRYRLGHLIKITSLRDEEAEIDLPQMVFEARADQLIDIAGFTRLSEKTISGVIKNTGLNYEDWTIRKEFADGKPVLSLYIELNNGKKPAEIASRLHEELTKVDRFYDSLDSMMDIKPLKVVPLRSGTFNEYYQRKVGNRSELSDTKPPRMNASDCVIDDLVQISKSRN